MQPAARKVAGRVALWIGVAACALALYERASSVPEPMKREDLARVSRQVRSDALEAAALARSLAVGELTTPFARAQHEQLAHDLDDARKKLDQPAPVGHEDAAQRLREAVERLDDDLGSVPVHMADASTLSLIARDEAAIADDVAHAGAGS